MTILVSLQNNARLPNEDGEVVLVFEHRSEVMDLNIFVFSWVAVIVTVSVQIILSRESRSTFWLASKSY